MTAAVSLPRTSGPGGGPRGVPRAIALSPILSARYRRRDLEAIASAAPGSRLVSVSLEGLADAELSDVEVLLRGPLPAGVFDRLIARCPALKWVHSATAGVERVLTPAARERGLAITNARGVFSEPIAEYVVMMILAVSRRLPQLLELQRERTWQPLEATELGDVTVGVVGLGSIGRRVAELAAAFGARVVAVRRGGSELEREAEGAPGTPPGELLRPAQLPELLGRSDFIVLALPLTRETEELFDGPMLGRAKRGSWLINVARGRLVDERALIRALREGPLGGAILDTFVEEPLPRDSPLYGLPNAIVTPHTAWSSGRALDRSIALFCDNLRRFAAGERLLNLVDPQLGY
ncbi:MAG: D-2-hydroxyacid dehydrogenase [Chloroflexota bacterium]|nr:D-2-hydroxyacid dehydrogenase [Chloroflexota bacterium]